MQQWLVRFRAAGTSLSGRCLHRPLFFARNFTGLFFDFGSGTRHHAQIPAIGR